MIVTRLETDEKSRRVKVFIDGEYYFFLYQKEVEQYKLEEEQIIDEKLYETILENIIYPRAKEKAISILGYSDRSESELRNKLDQAGYTGDIIKRVIEYVRLYGYVNDERYAEAFIRSKKQIKSKQAIITQLIQKGINKEIIDNVMNNEYNADEDDELNAIKKAVLKKTSSIDNLDYTQKQRLMASLYRKGFDLSKIKKVLE